MCVYIFVCLYVRIYIYKATKGSILIYFRILCKKNNKIKYVSFTLKIQTGIFSKLFGTDTVKF